MCVLQLPLLSAGAVAAGADWGGEVPLLNRQAIKIRELFTVLQLKKGKKDCCDTCLTYSYFWPPLRRP